MMWSRTSTACTGALLRDSRYVGTGCRFRQRGCSASARGDPRTRPAPRAAHPVGRRQAGSTPSPDAGDKSSLAVGWRDLADLARHELETAAVECPAERHRYVSVAIPAELEDRSLVSARSAPSQGQHCWHWRERPARTPTAPAPVSQNPDRSADAMAARAGLMSTRVTLADDSCRSSRPVKRRSRLLPRPPPFQEAPAGIPDGVQRGFHIGREHRPTAGRSPEQESRRLSGTSNRV